MATENVYLDSSVSGTCSTPANALGAADGTYTTDTGATSWTHTWHAPAPSTGSITSGATQTFVLRVRKQSGTGTPVINSVTIQFDQGGGTWSGQALSGSPWNVTSLVSQDVTATATFSGSFTGFSTRVSDAIRVVVATTGAGGSGSARAAVQLDAVNWQADVSSVATANAGTVQAAAVVNAPVANSKGQDGSPISASAVANAATAVFGVLGAAGTVVAGSAANSPSIKASKTAPDVTVATALVNPPLSLRLGTGDASVASVAYGATTQASVAPVNASAGESSAVASVYGATASTQADNQTNAPAGYVATTATALGASVSVGTRPNSVAASATIPVAGNAEKAVPEFVAVTGGAFAPVVVTAGGGVLAQAGSAVASVVAQGASAQGSTVEANAGVALVVVTANGVSRYTPSAERMLEVLGELREISVDLETRNLFASPEARDLFVVQEDRNVEVAK